MAWTSGAPDPPLVFRAKARGESKGDVVVWCEQVAGDAEGAQPAVRRLAPHRAQVQQQEHRAREQPGQRRRKVQHLPCSHELTTTPTYSKEPFSFKVRTS
jgi:hypothetical protein